MKTLLISFGLIIVVNAAFSEVNMHLNGNIFVETSDGGFVQIDGDLIQEDGSYFNGQLFSGSRSGCTGFSGVTLSPGLTGSIRCFTGSAYDKNNGEPTNFKRWYEIVNTSGSDLTTSINISYIQSGAYDERNGLTAGPFYILKYVDSWTKYANDAETPPPMSAQNVTIPNGLTSDWILSNEEAIAVALVSFMALVDHGAVVLSWETASEMNIAGFNILRSKDEIGDYQQVNSTLIPAKGYVTTGATYNYIDFPGESALFYYKLEDVSLDGKKTVGSQVSIQLVTGVLTRLAPPKEFILDQNYPNPFNPTTMLKFGIPRDEDVQLVIYNIRGEEIRTLVGAQLKAGTYNMIWDGFDNSGLRVSTGIYFYKMVSGDFVACKKMTLTK